MQAILLRLQSVQRLTVQGCPNPYNLKVASAKGKSYLHFANILLLIALTLIQMSDLTKTKSLFHAFWMIDVVPVY